MSKNQIKGRADESTGKAKEIAGKMTNDNSSEYAEYKDILEKHGRKAEGKYSDVKNDAERAGIMNHSTRQFENGYIADYDIPDDNAALLSAATITGDQVSNMQEVCNMQDENLGIIQDIMLDMNEGKIRYAVLATASFLGIGTRLFAIPWEALQRDPENQCFKLDMDIEHLKKAPSFDKDDWPNMANTSWNSTVDSYHAR